MIFINKYLLHFTAHLIVKGVFRTLSNIYDKAFLQK